MSSSLYASRPYFENALTPETTRAIGILQAALMAGPMVYAATLIGVTFVGMEPGEPDPSQVQMVQILSVLHAAFAAAAFGIAPYLFKFVFSARRLEKDQVTGSAGAPVGAWIVLLRSAIVLRLAILEGAAFFGLTVCLVAAPNGVLAAEPLYWLNLASTLFLVLFGLATFPTKERILSYFDEAAQPA